MTEDIEIRRRRAQFRASHRGTKEMDWLLGRYAEATLPTLHSGDLDRFERLLAISDPELQSWILAPEAQSGPEFEDFIGALRRFHGLA